MKKTNKVPPGLSPKNRGKIIDLLIGCYLGVYYLKDLSAKKLIVIFSRFPEVIDDDSFRNIRDNGNFRRMLEEIEVVIKPKAKEAPADKLHKLLKNEALFGRNNDLWKELATIHCAKFEGPCEHYIEGCHGTCRHEKSA